MVNAPTDECELCSLPVEGSPITDNGRVFCCTGCKGVYAILGSVDNEQQTEFIRDEPDRMADPPAGYQTSFFHIDGMHCVTCERHIELVAGKSEAVSGVEASYVSDTVRIDHDPAEVTEDELIDLLSGLGYRAFHRDDIKARKRAEERKILRIGAGLLAGALVMFAYMMLIYPTYFGDRIYGERATELIIEGLYYGAANYLFIVIGLLTSVVLFYTGWPIIRGAYVSLRARTPNMDLLITLAAMSAYTYSWLEIYVGGTHIYFDVSVAIILIVTLGGEHESKIKREALASLSNLTEIRVNEANKYLSDGSIEQVALDALAPGDRVIVREGERIPVDGTIVDGHCAVDESVITGESLPITKYAQDQVVGGSIVKDGSVIIEVGAEVQSSLDRITRLMWNLQSSNRGIQKLADKLATIFVPLVLIVAIAVTITYLVWLAADIPTALLVGLTVLIVSCPCALGLATPLAVAAGVRDSLAQGIVVFDDTIFERLRSVDTIIFDKTGTLTTGDMSVLETEGDQELFKLAAILEQRSAHPIANAISSTFTSKIPENTSVQTDGGVAREDFDHSTEPAVQSFQSFSNGVSGTVDGVPVMVGHPDLFISHEWDIPERLTKRTQEERRVGRVPVLVGREGKVEGMIVVGDLPRSGWERTITALADRGIEVVVLTGDENEAATAYKNHPDIAYVFAGVPPEGKAEVVKRFQADGRTVMVGDGTNDAPALASADLGIALGSGTAIAAEAADIAIVDDDLDTILTALDLSAAAGRRVNQNIGWAFVYNGIAIPLAITGLLNPLFAALAMGTSSILVVTNSMRKLG